MGRPRKLTDKRASNQSSISGFFNGRQNSCNEIDERNEVNLCQAQKRQISPHPTNSKQNCENKRPKNDLGCESNMDSEKTEASNIDRPKFAPIETNTESDSSGNKIHSEKPKESRHFQLAWKTKYPWIVYDSDNQKIKCSTCINAGVKNSFVRGTSMKIDNITKHLKTSGIYSILGLPVCINVTL